MKALCSARLISVPISMRSSKSAIIAAIRASRSTTSTASTGRTICMESGSRSLISRVSSLSNKTKKAMARASGETFSKRGSNSSQPAVFITADRNGSTPHRQFRRLSVPTPSLRRRTHIRCGHDSQVAQQELTQLLSLPVAHLVYSLHPLRGHSLSSLGLPFVLHSATRYATRRRQDKHFSAPAAKDTKDILTQKDLK